MAEKWQEERWQKLQNLVKRTDYLGQSNAILAKMARITVEFAQLNELILPFDAMLFDKTVHMIKATNRSKRLIIAVQQEKLGLNFTNQDDIDIVAPADMSDEQIAEYQNLGWVVFIGGVIILAASIVYTEYMEDEGWVQRKDYNKLFRASNSKFQEIGGQVLADWNKTIAEEGFKIKKQEASRLASLAKKVTGGLSSGLMIGLAVGIPLLIFMKK